MALNILRSSVILPRRILFRTPARILSVNKPVLNKKEIEVTFVKANGERIKAKGKVGDSLLDVVVNNDLDLDGFGACEGTLTCSTCHLIFKKDVYESLPEKPTDEELDMLDLAYDLTDTSRLGCQIILSEKLDGLEVKLEVPGCIREVGRQALVSVAHRRGIVIRAPIERLSNWSHFMSL